MQIYHNPRCSKSRQTLQLIQDAGIEPEIIEYLKNPLSQTQIKDLVSKLGISAMELVRKKEKVIKEEDIEINNDKDAIKAMANYPVLIERPIVVKGKKAVLGRPPENVNELI